MRHRILFTKDSTITDAFKKTSPFAGLAGSIRATGSNMGASETLQLFKIYGDVTSGSLERSRILLQFDVNDIARKMVSGSIPSGSAKFYLKMYNQPHEETIPTSFDLAIYPLSQSWDEGSGLDVINYLDSGYANWHSASSVLGWLTTGSSFVSTISASQHFDTGEENLETEITNIVYEWITGTLFTNNGLVIKLVASQEENNTTDYFIKKFFARNTHFQQYTPYAYVEWDDSNQDQRANFIYDADNTLYLYNRKRGALTNLNNDPTQLFVKVVNHLTTGSQSYSVVFTASKKSTGVYTASIYITSSLVPAISSSIIYDIWFSASNTYSTGTILPIFQTASFVNDVKLYHLAMPNLKQTYERNEEAKLRLVTLPFTYNPPVQETGSNQVPLKVFDNIYYEILDYQTREIIIPFGTGTVKSTRLSSDEVGNYFNLWLSSFNHGRLYEIKYLAEENGEKRIFEQEFVFKVK